MRPNIFIYKNLTNEDHFTNSLGYVLNLFPTVLGNRFLFKLANLCGYSNDYFGKFKEAKFTGHHLQNIDSTSKPDMIIYTSKTQIFFEIKLKASLSLNQLERHFADVDKTKGYLLLVSNIQTPVSEGILKRKKYIKPKGQNHFIWSDFESVFTIKFRKGVLEQRLFDDFKQGLRANGIRGRQIVGAKGNLYTNGSDAENLVLDNLKLMLKEIGFSAWRPNREYTLRVNAKKIGVDPLLNPRIYSSGEWLDENCTKECMIIHCFSRREKRSAVKKIHNLRALESTFSDIAFFHHILDDTFIVELYIPFKFIPRGNFFDIDWNYLKKVWRNIYEIIK